MTIPNTSPTPPVWTDAQLEEHAQASLNAFVDRRLKEPKDQYLTHLRQCHSDLGKLFRELAHVDPINPDAATVRKVLLNNDLLSALRYVTGPPVSEDDLSVIVTRSPVRMTKKQLSSSEYLPGEVLKLICSMADPVRFPWIGTGRAPLLHELKTAIRATVALHATQTMQTMRRGYGKNVERQLEKHLIDLGFTKSPPPAKARIRAPKDYPGAKCFYGECTVYQRKTDLLIGLRDGRIVAVEAKNSSSVVNSVKRVLNDTAAKAKSWHNAAGLQIIPVALLSGVFGLENLKSAQTSGLYLVWAHDLKSFSDWLATQQ